LNLTFDWNDFPTVTEDLHGTGGRIRATPEDFEVTEEGAYPLSGSGEHLYLWIEKRGNTTKYVVDEIARQLGVKFKDIGVAGLKDRHAVTRQWISLPRKFESKLSEFTLPGTEILSTTAHGNKLGIGHLRGNRFRIRVRDTQPNSLERAERTLERLRTLGVPNYFGPQRFGNTGTNAVRGLELVRDGRPESIPIKRFLIASLQSLLYNHILRLRLERDVFAGFLHGDVAKKHDTGGVFIVEDASTEQPRAARLEVSATAPLYGRKVTPVAQFESRALEDEVLGLFDLNWEHFKDRHGDRRITRIKLGEAKLEEAIDGYWIEFSLPKGCFATVVLREVLKVNVDGVEEDLSADER
jgi:tRNA pseudouridine13 synthase